MKFLNKATYYLEYTLSFFTFHIESGLFDEPDHDGGGGGGGGGAAVCPPHTSTLCNSRQLSNLRVRGECKQQDLSP